MQANIHGAYGLDGVQDLCGDAVAGFPAPSALTLVPDEPVLYPPIGPDEVKYTIPAGMGAPDVPKAEDQCFGWRCPGCRSCHAPTTQTCPVCDARKLPLVQSFIIKALQTELDAAPNTLTSATAPYTTVYVQRLLEAVVKHHQRA